MVERKIKMGMVGGSLEGFIGAVHRMAASLDGTIELAAGCFSSDAEKSRNTGKSLFLNEDRIYSTIEEMVAREQQLPAGERIDFISIVTPNHLHYHQARLAAENGFNVLCEKPLAYSAEEAADLCKIVKEKGVVFGVTHNYTGYPMVKEAREIIRSGRLGKIRKVVAEYHQGWLSDLIEKEGQKQAGWRTDPAKAGLSCCTGDIGTHAENLVEYITGLKIQELCADVSSMVPGRLLDDDANILVRFDNGAKGTILASQIANGEENELRVRIYGENGGLEWLQSDPNSLILKSNTEPRKILRTGGGYSYLSEAALKHTRLPGGHPEGYIESMANIYRNFAMAVAADKTGNSIYDFPTIEDGLRGMRFIEAVIESGRKNAAWVNLT